MEESEKVRRIEDWYIKVDLGVMGMKYVEYEMKG